MAAAPAWAPLLTMYHAHVQITDANRRRGPVSRQFIAARARSSLLGQRRDTLQVIDKHTLEVIGSVTPLPGKTAAHVEFTSDGRFALVRERKLAEIKGQEAKP